MSTLNFLSVSMIIGVKVELRIQTSQENATDPEDMADWVSFFHDDWNVTKGCFNTYNPINMQSRFLFATTETLTKLLMNFT
eukprot:UN19295